MTSVSLCVRAHSVELRRLNMRSVVGRKDVFLSYAHINIQFAKKIKVYRAVACMYTCSKSIN